MDKATALAAALAAMFGVLATLTTNLLTRGRWEGKVTQLLEQHSGEIGELKKSKSEQWEKLNDHTGRIIGLEKDCDARHGNGHTHRGGFHD